MSMYDEPDWDQVEVNEMRDTRNTDLLRRLERLRARVAAVPLVAENQDDAVQKLSEYVAELIDMVQEIAMRG